MGLFLFPIPKLPNPPTRDQVGAYMAKNRWQLPNFRQGGAGSYDTIKPEKKFLEFYLPENQ
jgi:hypothetical protein